MITQIGYEEDDSDCLGPGEAPVVDAIENQEVLSSEQLQPALQPPESDAVAQEDEFAEEDEWLLACHFLDDDDEHERDPERYVPQLMDAREMRQLRATLRKSEAQIQTCGRMREFTPHKPAASPESHACRRTPSIGAQGSSRDSNAQMQKSDAPLMTGSTHTFLTAVPPSTSHHRKQDFAVVLRRELRQVRELEARYEETKRMLLEQMDVICSLKPSERTGGAETYEKLSKLMAFVRLCQAPSVPDS